MPAWRPNSSSLVIAVPGIQNRIDTLDERIDPVHFCARPRDPLLFLGGEFALLESAVLALDCGDELVQSVRLLEPARVAK